MTSHKKLTTDIEYLRSLSIACFAGKQLTKLRLRNVGPIVLILTETCRRGTGGANYNAKN
jgi:hypothetical protein